MITLSGIWDEPINEEERYYLQAALSDMYFARSLLRDVGEEERERFNEVGFAYGDSSMMGYSPYDVYEAQMESILYTLFGEGYAGDIACVMLYEDAEQDTLQRIAALDGGPLHIEGLNPGALMAQGGYEEVLIVELRTYGSGPPGTDADNLTDNPANNPSAQQRLHALATAIRASYGESGSPRLYRWREDSDQAAYLRERGEQRDTILLVYGAEPFYPHDLFHEDVFNLLVRAWMNWPEHLIQRTNHADSQRTPEEGGLKR